MTSQYVDAWSVARYQGDIDRLMPASMQSLMLRSTLLADGISSVDADAFMIKRDHRLFIEIDVVAWLNENAKDWVLDIDMREIMLRSNNAWEFIEWFSEPE